MFVEGKTVAVEYVESVYLRNNVVWKKFSGKEWILRVCFEKKRSRIMAV